MKSHIKRLFSDSASFALATMGNKIVSFFLAPLWISYFNIRGEMAIWGSTNVYTLILTYVSMLGTDTAMAYYFFAAKDERDRKLFFFNGIALSSLLCIIYSVCMFFLSSSLGSIFFRTNDYGDLLFVATMATVGAIIIQHILGYIRYSRRVWLFNIFSMTYVVGTSLISLLFVINGKRLMGFFYGQLIGQVILALILIYIVRKEFVYKFSKHHMSDLIKYGFPLLPSLISFWVITSISRPILINLASLGVADIFEGAIRVATMIVLLTAPFQLAWRPFSMSIREREDAPRLFTLVGKILFVVGTLLIMIMTFFAENIYTVITAGREDVASGYIYVWFLSLGTLFNVLHTVLGVGLLIKKQTRKISQSFMIASVIYLIGIILLVPMFQIWGVVGMTVVAYFIVLVLVYKQNQKVFPIDFPIVAMLIYLFIYLCLMIMITCVQVYHIRYPWMYYIGTFILMLLTSYATGLISKNNMNQLGNFMVRLTRRGW